MPFSSNSGKNLIDRAVQRISEENPQSTLRVLDVGVGSGTYFDRYSSSLLPKPRTVWVGIEIWKPYVEKYSLMSKYDVLQEEDARIVTKRINQKSELELLDNRNIYDICFVGDVAEHMTKEEAQAMVATLSEISRLVILSIPIGHYPQDEYDGNPFEKHIKDDWSVDEVLASFNHICEYGVENEIGVFFISKNYRADILNLLRPKIAVYGICKNEERFVQRFADSIRTADAISICDTGSTDKTLEYLNTYLPEAKVYNTSVNPWRFDDARNNALMLLPTDIDLCISLDFDEYLQEGWKNILEIEVFNHLRTRGRVFDKYNCRFQTIWDWETLGPSDISKNMSSHWHERIHTRHNWRWKLPVHEILYFTGTNHQEAWAWLGGFLMTQKPETKDRSGAYLPLLEQSVAEDPKIWKSWFFYADELLKANRRDDAITALKKALDIPGSDVSYLNSALGDYYKPIDMMTASQHYQKACQLAPLSRERWVTYATFCRDSNMMDSARLAIQNAKKCTTQSTGYDFNAWCWGPGFDALYNELLGVKV